MNMAQNYDQGGQPHEQQFTLANMNELLNAAGFPIINAQKAAVLQGLAPKQRIIAAVQRANSDPAARSFLVNLFNSANIPVNNGCTNQPQPTQQEYAQNQNQSAASYDNHYPDNSGGNDAGDQAAPGETGSNGSARLDPADRMSMHVYGGKAALCFEADKTKSGFDTIALDGATASGPKQYNWSDKIRIQMTRAELPVVAAVFLGIQPSCEFKNHGPANNKGFAIERQQGGKFFVKVFAANEGVRAVPVMASDAFYVASLVMRQIQKGNPWLDGPSIMAVVRATQS